MRVQERNLPVRGIMHLATSSLVAVYAFLRIRRARDTALSGSRAVLREGLARLVAGGRPPRRSGDACQGNPMKTRVTTPHFFRCKPATRIAKEDADGYCSKGCSNPVDPFLEQGPGRREKG
jgi:hypothetical protein